MAREVVAPRGALIEWLAKRIEREHFPRLALSGLLTLSVLIGFLTSSILLQHAWYSLPLRYGLGSLAGCLSFIALIRAWADRYHGAAMSQGYLRNVERDVAAVEARPSSETSGVVPRRSSDSVGGEVIETGLDLATSPWTWNALDDGILYLIPVAIFLAIVAGLVGAVTVVAGAPALMAEVIVDALIAGEVYRRVRMVSNQHWLHGILRRTWKPMTLIVVTMVVAGALMQKFFPGADSIGDIFVPIP